MIRISAYILATITSVGILCGSTASAMEIARFDKMALPDQKEYVGRLVEGAQEVLRDDHHSDLAEQVARLFTTKDPQGNISIGMTQFEVLLARARLADLERIKKDPSAARLEVERAMILTLKKNSIGLSPAFMHVADKFRPKLPPKN